MEQKNQKIFTGYETFVITIISLLQFTIILDFMVMAPLGAELIRILKISPSQFGWVVSAYAFSAGIAGILAAGFADKFDRKKMLLFFYAGFIVGTLLCGIAPDYHFLLLARMVTGFFGGVLFSINMAIVADLFPLEKRGRVMGFVQMAFAVSQVLGIPVGLYFANEFGWHMPFLMIVGVCVPVGVVIVRWMKPIDSHLKERAVLRPMVHLRRTGSQKRYLRAFSATALLSTGGFLMMPYSSTFLVRNVGIDEKVLPVVFVVAGFVGLFMGPLIGKLSDRVGKFRMFIAGSLLASLIVPIFSALSVTPLWEVLILNSLMYTAVFSRLIPSQALISGVPDAKDRGAFMSINSSIQQLGGGIASVIGGWIIGQNAAGLLVHYNVLGWVTIAAFFACAVLMYAVNGYVMAKSAEQKTLSFS
ncbi:MAG TPA: MFS transporter [Puia sp.]|jgi:predicted MFS family arabinose efflux permease